MGYRSEVGYAIAFTSQERLRQFVASRPADAMAQLRADGLRTAYGGTTLVYHDPAVKWYPTRLTGGSGDTPADRHEQLLAASAAWDGPLVGVFVRVGEDTGDIEDETWGEYGYDDGLPDPWDLVQVVQTMDIGWECGPDGDPAWPLGDPSYRGR